MDKRSKTFNSSFYASKPSLVQINHVKLVQVNFSSQQLLSLKINIVELSRGHLFRRNASKIHFSP